jgi:hypothetical protein
MLQTLETAHSERTETEANSGRQSYFQQTASKTFFLELKYYVYLLGKHHNMSPLMVFQRGERRKSSDGPDYIQLTLFL